MTRGQKTAGIILGGLFAGTMLLGACGNDPANPDGGPNDANYGVAHVSVDGRDVTCVTMDIYNGGGISCNWEEFNKDSK